MDSQIIFREKFDEVVELEAKKMVDYDRMVYICLGG